jgi:hypothetical protein
MALGGVHRGIVPDALEVRTRAKLGRTANVRGKDGSG